MDLTTKLDNDTAMHVLQNLDTPRDVASASRVSSSWRHLVREAQLWRGICFKEFPEVKMFEEVRMRDQQAAKQEREERIYRTLLQELKGEPMIDRSCIRDAICASSTDNLPEESIYKTLYPRTRVEPTSAYWSSTGQDDVNVPETLTYNLVSPLCVVHEVCIRPFQAFFHRGHPIYSAMHVRIRLGHARSDGTDYEWTYESEKFPMEQVDSVQVFKLPRPVLCIGGVLQVELLGRVQTQEMDQLYYICIAHVSVVGRPLLNFKADRLGNHSRFGLEFTGRRLKENASGGGGGEAATRSLLERLWQFRMRLM